MAFWKSSWITAQLPLCLCDQRPWMEKWRKRDNALIFFKPPFHSSYLKQAWANRKPKSSYEQTSRLKPKKWYDFSLVCFYRLLRVSWKTVLPCYPLTKLLILNLKYIRFQSKVYQTGKQKSPIQLHTIIVQNGPKDSQRKLTKTIMGNWKNLPWVVTAVH